MHLGYETGRTLYERSASLAKGLDFDTDVHEAVTMFPVQDEGQKGKVIDVMQTGYKLGEKVIRFAKVIVGQ